ncbi:MAG TPA: hypothetical protein VLS90_00985 [Thermodesulfobacteriota bacterium]|nr:hypothetical protein [Thermodesulfobacteriota bacterium]
MEYSLMDWLVLIILVPFNLGFISVLIGVPAIATWVLYMVLTGKGHAGSGKIGPSPG